MQRCECYYQPVAHNSSGSITSARGVDPATAAGLDAAAELLRALANPHRLAIVHELGAHSRCVHELVDALGVSQPLVSQHLRVLRSSHLVRAERRGREIAYSLGDQHVAHIVHDAIAHAAELRPARELPTTEEP
ncbi:MAG: metalloregulator ArsR/SmtB family transcription factor [Actinobacteria bacterium]|nr:metalloregulator ArsR/SmtB family transcription factor [Actinomycetota bacterium]MBW3650523.1 metalloregulator ArsR/SmtB family transcription factor [Actinomycetota bacterium]